MKNNPLFIDSTKFKGESIVAELEVEGVSLHPTERLVVNITLSDNRVYTQNLVLKNNKHVGSVRLCYRTPAWIKHTIMCGSNKIEESNEVKFEVNYINQFKWYRPIRMLTELAGKVV